MEIQNTLLNSLYQAVARIQNGPPPASQPPGADGAPALGRTTEVENPGRVFPKLNSFQNVDASDLLSPEEKKLLSILFDGQGSTDLKLYGLQPARPAEVGNFIDLRG